MYFILPVQNEINVHDLHISFRKSNNNNNKKQNENVKYETINSNENLYVRASERFITQNINHIKIKTTTTTTMKRIRYLSH